MRKKFTMYLPYVDVLYVRKKKFKNVKKKLFITRHKNRSGRSGGGSGGFFRNPWNCRNCKKVQNLQNLQKSAKLAMCQTIEGNFGKFSKPRIMQECKPSKFHRKTQFFCDLFCVQGIVKMEGQKSDWFLHSLSCFS